MHTRTIAGVAGFAALASSCFAQAGNGISGIDAELFVLPPILLTDDTANEVRVIHRRGDGSGNGGNNNDGNQGGSGNPGGEPAPRAPYLFGAQTDFRGEVNNRLDRSTDFLVVNIIPDPVHDYAPGEFESLSFDRDAGVGIEPVDTADAGDAGGAPSFEYSFSADNTSVRIDFTGGDTFDAGEALEFFFSVVNDSGEGVPLGFQFVVPTPGTAALLCAAGVFVFRRGR